MILSSEEYDKHSSTILATEQEFWNGYHEKIGENMRQCYVETGMKWISMTAPGDENIYLLFQKLLKKYFPPEILFNSFN